MTTFDFVTYTTDEKGNPGAGWHRVRAHGALSFRNDLIRLGQEALSTLPAGAARDAVLQWVSTLADTDGPAMAGTYPLGDGRSVVVQEATHANLERVRAQSAWGARSNSRRGRSAAPPERPARAAIRR